MKKHLVAILVFGVSATASAARKKTAAPLPPADKILQMDVPIEWMRLSQDLRNDVVNVGSEEVDVKWAPTGNFFRPLNTFSGDKALQTEWGNVSSAYTSTNLAPHWRDASLRLRGELSYASFVTDAVKNFRLHDLNLTAGAYIEPKLLRWSMGGGGGVGIAVQALWEQWFAPQSRQSLAQSGNGGGTQNALEIRQAIGKTKVKAVLTLARRDYFIATDYRSTWVTGLGVGVAL